MSPVTRPALFSLAFLFLSAAPAFAGSGGIDGTLTDATGKPLNGKTLMLQDGQDAAVATTTSDDAGHYAFHDVPDATYALLATEKDAVLTTAAVTVTGSNTTHQDIGVQPNQPLTVVISRQREAFRNSLSPQTGTNAYKIDNTAIEALPQGDNTSFDKVLEQAPGVVQDSFGQVHVRGEHADLQYRLNGIILPEGISGFGQTIDPRLIESSTLLDGALPAQYGYRTAGVVDLQTKSGFDNSGTAEIFGGSHGTIEPSVSYGGTYDTADYFFTASHLSSDLGIEAPTSSTHTLHDHTDQDKEFGYGSYMINPYQRVELIAGSSIGNFHIPNTPNQTPNYTLNGVSNFNSSQLNETQYESNQYATAAWQGSKEDVALQIAPYMRESETHYRPDSVGDLVFNGVASDVLRTDLATGIQADGSWRVNSDHTLRSGLMIQNDYAVTDNTSSVFPANPVTGAQLSTTPETIVDNSSKNGQLYGIYAQDEWKLTPQLTLNYGARFDAVSAYVSENQLSPRINMVYKPDDTTTLHAGYARYFTPPPLELVAPESIAKFAGTTNQAVVTADDPVKSERSHSFDIGATHDVTKQIQLGIDGYYKLVHDLLDEGQFGQALIYAPFNYEHGQVYGTEVTASYTGEKVKAYANFAASRAVGEDIVSSQFNFTDPAELAYITNHYVHLDHDQTYTASGGVSYQLLPKTTVGMTGIFGSGLRSGFANEDHLPWYTQFDASVTQDLDLIPNDKTTLRFSIVNIFDTSYELRDGTGIGVGAPQYGPRRGFFVGLAQGF